MSKIVLSISFYDALNVLDEIVADANSRKIKLLFDALGIKFTTSEYAMVTAWDLILVAVADRQMAVQLNKLATYIPNLKFIVDINTELFTVSPGKKAKRVWKER